MFSLTEWSSTRPCARRSSGMRAKPFLITFFGLVGWMSLPPSRMSPDCRGVRPKSAWTSSVLPDPISPARPRISPRRRLNDTSVKNPSMLRSVTSRRTSSAMFYERSCLARWPPCRLPIMASTISAGVRAARESVSVFLPSRSTVIRSAIW